MSCPSPTSSIPASYGSMAGNRSCTTPTVVSPPGPPGPPPGPIPVRWDTVPENQPLRLYNSLGRRLEDFVPAGPVAGLYSCGPTVYAYPHLGNMRAYVFADTLRRVLRWKAIPVRHVVNITDV